MFSSEGKLIVPIIAKCGEAPGRNKVKLLSFQIRSVCTVVVNPIYSSVNGRMHVFTSQRLKIEKQNRKWNINKSQIIAAHFPSLKHSQSHSKPVTDDSLLGLVVGTKDGGNSTDVESLASVGTSTLL